MNQPDVQETRNPNHIIKNLHLFKTCSSPQMNPYTSQNPPNSSNVDQAAVEKKTEPH